MNGTGERYVISVLVGDRVGVLRDIAAAVTGMHANIDGISQTVVEGYFTVILTATFPEPVEPSAIEHAISLNFGTDEANIVVRPYGDTPPPAPVPNGERYVITLSGSDSPGIVRAITTFLAEKSINIEDWYVLFQDNQVTHVGAIRVPRRLDLRQLQDQVETALAGFQLTAGIQHENIFRVTNEVGPIRALLNASSS